METIIFAALIAIGVSMELILLGLYFSTPAERRDYMDTPRTLSVAAIAALIIAFGVIGYIL